MVMTMMGNSQKAVANKGSRVVLRGSGLSFVGVHAPWDYIVQSGSGLFNIYIINSPDRFRAVPDYSINYFIRTAIGEAAPTYSFPQHSV